jgi:hypothetical protein
MHRSRNFVTLTLAALVLATAGLAAADHYPDVPSTVKRKDRSALSALQRLSYADAYEETLEPSTCGCLEPTCDGGGQFMVSCGGEVEPFYAGILTAVRRTSRETCLVCGCAADWATLRATPVCLGF